MSKLSLNDISNDIFKHIPNNSIDKNMLNEEVIEVIDSINNYQTSTDNNLNTTDKNIVGAINELLDDANSRMFDIKNAIGIEADTTTAMGNKIEDINNTLSTFISNNGGSVTGEESLSELLDILYTVTKIKFPIQWIDDCKYIACGYSHTVLVKIDGTVWSCGYNNYGQLGLGDYVNRTSFTQVDISDVNYVACGGNHTFLIKNDGSVWCCGYNSNYQLGLGDTTERTTFTQVTTGTGAKQISCGYRHTFLLKNDGSVWACGYNYYGQLGLGNNDNNTTFTQVNISDAKQIACGYDFTFLLKNDGSVYSCGDNYNGQLGLGSNTVQKYSSFTQVTTNVDNDVKQVSCGQYHTLLLKNDGSVYGCGKNNYGQLSLDSTSSTYYNFVQTTHNINNDVAQISCGYLHSFIIKNDGSVYSCGHPGYGQLGRTIDSTTSPSTAFNVVTTNVDNDVKQISCGQYHTLLLKNDGTVWACGYNNTYQLGLGDTTNRDVFTDTLVTLNE